MGAEHSAELLSGHVAGNERMAGIQGPMTPTETREHHRRTLQRTLEADRRQRTMGAVRLDFPINLLPGFGGGCGWQNHRPPADLDTLQPITVPELQLKKVHKGCVLWGTLCERCHYCGGIYSVLQDEHDPEAIVIVSFHDGFEAKSQAEAEVEFPVGAKIGIQEPLFKVYRDGSTGIRVDDMRHVFGDVEREGTSRSRRTRWKPQHKHRQAEDDGRGSDPCHACGHVPHSGKLQRCSGCFLATYCSSTCQKKHWKIHKKTCTSKQPGLKNYLPADALEKGLYTKHSDFKTAREPLSTTPEAQFRWSKDLWACSPPDISVDGRIATNVQMEAVCCSTAPFGADVTLCNLRVLPPVAEVMSVGLCMIDKGKIGRSWKYDSDGNKFCGDKLQRYAEGFGVGDIISVSLKNGNLSFAKNGKDLGVCYSGFAQVAPHRYYLRASFCAGYRNGMPILGRANGGRWEILEPPFFIGDKVTIMRLSQRAKFNDRQGIVENHLPDGQVSVRLLDSKELVEVHPSNLERVRQQDIPTDDGGDDKCGGGGGQGCGSGRAVSSTDLPPEDRDDLAAPVAETHHIEHSPASASHLDPCFRGEINSDGLLAACRVCAERLPRASFSKRSWKNWKSDRTPPKCLQCSE